MTFSFPLSIPLPWLLADLFTVGVTLYLFAALLRRTQHPAVLMLEAFGFVFLYASVFENFAVANGWYVYGRSLFMVGVVPLSVPLVEACVLFAGLWILDAMDIPDFLKPVLLGWFGMLQDLSLDPVAVRQIFTIQNVTSGRWTWILTPGAASFYNIPVYNFPGWMLIMLYGSAFLLLGRWWFRRSQHQRWVGYVYPLAAAVLALLAMISPLSQFLLWLGPFFSKGSAAEWVMLAFHLVVPLLLLVFVWRGRMTRRLSFSSAAPALLTPILFHAFDIAAVIQGGYWDVLWIVVSASCFETAVLACIFWISSRTPNKQPSYPSGQGLYIEKDRPSPI